MGGGGEGGGRGGEKMEGTGRGEETEVEDVDEEKGEEKEEGPAREGHGTPRGTEEGGVHFWYWCAVVGGEGGEAEKR